MAVTLEYLGHSGFHISDGSMAVLIDPFLRGNPVARRKPDEIRCDYIALTHGHADHLGDTVEIAKRNKAPVFGAFELTEEFLGEKGVECEPMNPGGRVTTPFGWVALTQAIHSSSFEGRYLGQPCGVVLNIGGVTLYHCGDTALFSDMKLIGEIYKPDIAMIPIGDRFTMGPELASRAAEFIKPKIAIPIHYNTWPPIEQDPSTFRPAGGIEVRALKPGETMTYG